MLMQNRIASKKWIVGWMVVSIDIVDICIDIDNGLLIFRIVGIFVDLIMLTSSNSVKRKEPDCIFVD